MVWVTTIIVHYYSSQCGIPISSLISQIDNKSCAHLCICCKLNRKVNVLITHIIIYYIHRNNNELWYWIVLTSSLYATMAIRTPVWSLVWTLSTHIWTMAFRTNRIIFNMLVVPTLPDISNANTTSAPFEQAVSNIYSNYYISEQCCHC